MLTYYVIYNTLYMTDITYINGDATKPIGDGTRYIIHICNNLGVWGKGFVRAISAKWKRPETIYKKKHNYKLGGVGIVRVEQDIYISQI